MKVNWHRVIAYLLWVLSFFGMISAILLDTNAIEWALATLVSYGIVRLEWFLSALTEAKNTDDTHDQDYTA